MKKQTFTLRERYLRSGSALRGAYGPSGPVLLGVVLLILFLAGCAEKVPGTSRPGTPEPMKRTAPENILVSPAWVAENSEEVVVLDYARSMDDFRQGHIPGAAWVARAVTVTNVDGIDGMLPDPEIVAMDLEEAGVRHDTPVVVYDSGNGLWASRLFWALEYLGHEQVHLLDGGIAAWTSSGHELSSEITAPALGSFEARIREQLLADEALVFENHGNSDFTVLDARSPDEFSGADVRAARGGHIPNSTNIDWVHNLGDDGTFLSVSELSELYEQTLDGRDGPRVTLCQTGIRGAHTYVALRVLGEEDVRLYDGSWAEWGNNADAPIAAGSAP